MSQAKFHQSDDHFRNFITQLEPILATYGKNTEALQEKQVNRLVELERLFRKKLVRHDRGPDVYKEFIRHIVSVKRNILMARPYFRQRDLIFKSQISPALKDRDHLRLYQFDINHNFVDFVIKLCPWKDSKGGLELLKIAQQIRNLRRDIVECNLPLAISQARAFLDRNRRSHLRFMDINQSCAVGLLEGVDKYCGPYTRCFRAVLIGRMLSNLIEQNSETYFHFYPPDKRRIYRARKIIGQLGRDGPVEMADVCAKLNEAEVVDNQDREDDRMERQVLDGVVRKSHPDPMTSVGDLVNLLSAAQVLPSSSLPVGDDDTDGVNAIEKFPARDDWRPDVRCEEAEARHAVADAMQGLKMVDRKLLQMRGVEL